MESATPPPQHSPIMGFSPLGPNGLTQTDQIRRVNTFGEGRFGGQPRQYILHNASRGFSAIAEFPMPSHNRYTWPEMVLFAGEADGRIY